MSKHGGTPESGLVLPAGIEQHQLAPGSSILLEPEVAKQSRERKQRALQFERRRVALEMLAGLAGTGGLDDSNVVADVKASLKYADELLLQTGGEV